jgi:hypothetical protein
MWYPKRLERQFIKITRENMDPSRQMPEIEASFDKERA